jgi:2-polyprenyl-3-methyl-5-hydroxy-6-metoxy-1,4-benzoquinol methylase
LAANMKNNIDKNPSSAVCTYFDKYAVEFDSIYNGKRNRFLRWADRKFRSDTFERFRLAFEALEPLEDKTLLDVGCGSGRYIVEAAKRGARRITGIDVSPEMINLAQHYAHSNHILDKCEFIIGTFPQGVPHEQFDYAIAMGVMDYVPDALTFLSALAKQVKYRVVLSFPSKHWFRTPLRLIRYRLKRCPVYFYNAKQIEQLMVRAGFSNVRIKKIPRAGMDYVVIGDCI